MRAEAELLAGAPWLSAIGKLLLAWGAFADEMLLSRGAAELGAAEQDAAGREDARLHREDAAGRGRLNGPLLL